MKGIVSLETFELIREAGVKLFNETLEHLNEKDANGKTPIMQMLDTITLK